MARQRPSWDPRLYLKFERERTLPCRDLVARIELESPRQIADLGCGPGNSTAVLRRRWPSATLTGIDSSPQMLEEAGRSDPKARWLLADVGQWRPSGSYDLLFSNAALHWLPAHKVLLPRLMGALTADGALAFQIPSKAGAWRRIIGEVAAGARWRGRFPKGALALHSGGMGFYYDVLSPHASRVDVWETEYGHVLPGPEAVVEWTKGSALRPLLEALPKAEAEAFLAAYGREVARAYPRRADGKVLFPFRRTFVIAYR